MKNEMGNMEKGMKNDMGNKLLVAGLENQFDRLLFKSTVLKFCGKIV